jgi:hypothetical protein
MVINDPAILELNIQVFSDLLMSSDGRVDSQRLTAEEPQVVDIYLTNPDIIYADKWPHPRYAAAIMINSLKTMML